MAPVGSLRPNHIIYDELCLGQVRDDSRQLLLDIIRRHGETEEKPIEGVILGCTELGMIVKPAHVGLPLFDTTAIHVEAVLNFSLQG